MREYMEIEFSSRQAGFFVFLLLVILVAVFFFGFHQGKRYERTHAEDKADLEKQNVAGETSSSKESNLPPDSEEGIQTEKVVSPEDVVVQFGERQDSGDAEETNILTAGESLYFVQVGAFSNRDYALGMMERFQKRGYDASLFEPEQNFRYYRVVVGGFRTEEEASRLKTDLEERDRTKYYIIQHEKK